MLKFLWHQVKAAGLGRVLRKPRGRKYPGLGFFFFFFWGRRGGHRTPVLPLTEVGHPEILPVDSHSPCSSYYWTMFLVLVPSTSNSENMDRKPRHSREQFPAAPLPIPPKCPCHVGCRSIFPHWPLKPAEKFIILPADSWCQVVGCSVAPPSL